MTSTDLRPAEAPAGSATKEALAAAVEKDIWTWLNGFVTVNNAFYAGKFPPCPYARAAILASQVDVKVFPSGGDAKQFIRDRTFEMVNAPGLSTRVMGFPPRFLMAWGMTEFVESLNAEVIPHNLFLNTGVTKTMASRYPGSRAGDPYFIVVANRWDAVLSGSKALERTDYYGNWPRDQFELVVRRRARLIERYSAKDVA